MAKITFSPNQPFIWANKQTSNYIVCVFVCLSEHEREKSNTTAPWARLNAASKTQSHTQTHKHTDWDWPGWMSESTDKVGSGQFLQHIESAHCVTLETQTQDQKVTGSNQSIQSVHWVLVALCLFKHDLFTLHDCTESMSWRLVDIHTDRWLTVSCFI